MTRLEVEKLLSRSSGEDVPGYVARVSKLFPTWPEDVILQWAGGHPGYVSEFADALPLERLRFELVRYRASELPGAEVFLDEEAFQYAAECARSGDAASLPWFSRLWEYMKTNRTWPRPVVLLRTEGVAPFSIRHPRLLFAKSRHPFQILDGHRRLAFANVLREQGELAEELPVWIVDAA
jgi:hypothetical protein